MPDGRSSPARKQALRDQMARRKRDPETHRILASDTGFAHARGPARAAFSETRDDRPSVGQLFEHAHREHSTSRPLKNTPDAPHLDLTPTPALAQFDLAPRPVQPVPLSMKQEHSAEAILAAIPANLDHSGHALGGEFVRSMLAELGAACGRGDLYAAKQLAGQIMSQGRFSRAELLDYMRPFIA